MNEQTHIPDVTELESFDLNLDLATASHIVAFNKRDSQTRPFILLRTQLLKLMEQEGWRSVGITSATPGAGKSFLSMNLAAAVSRLPERQAYLFDFDLRRGSVAEGLNLPEGLGLNAYLEDNSIELRSVGLQIADRNLSIYPCFKDHADSSALVSSERCQSLCSSFKTLPSSAIVICDLPPVFANDDAMILAQQLDCYILIIEQGKTTRKQVADAMRLLEPAPCVGTIFNRYRGGIGDPYGYGYGYGDKYGDYYAS